MVTVCVICWNSFAVLILQNEIEQIEIHALRASIFTPFLKTNEINVTNIDLVCVSGSGGKLLHLYLDLLGNCGCVLWQRHSQQAVFEFGKDLIAVHKGRQGEGSEEFTIVTFDAVKILALEFFVKLALSS